MAGKALCQDPSKAAGKIKTKSLPKRRLETVEKPLRWVFLDSSAPACGPVSPNFCENLAGYGVFSRHMSVKKHPIEKACGSAGFFDKLKPAEAQAFFFPSPEGQSKAPRQTRGWGAGESIFCVGERGVPGGISPLVQWPPGGLSVHFPPVESGRRSPRPQARPRERQAGMRPPAFTARTWPPGAPPNIPGCASGWCCRPPE